MKRLLSILFFLVTIFAVSGVCSALEKEDLNIDGIYMNQRMSEVFARYGKPDRIEHGIPVGRICIYNINGGELRVSASSAEESGTVNCNKVISDKRLTKCGIDGNTYDAKLYEVCWECGNSDSVYCAADFDLIEENLKNDKHLVLVNVKMTAGGNIKFYYRCNGCGNFWVRTICEANKHPLIKHTENNYHVPEDDDIWYVKCPKCDPIIL